MSSSAAVMAPSWREQPAPPPSTNRTLFTPAARSLMRSKKVGPADLQIAVGTVVRLADVLTSTVTPVLDTPASSSTEREQPEQALAARAPASSHATADLFGAGIGTVVVDAVTEGVEELGVRMACLLRAAARVLRGDATRSPVGATVVVLGAERRDPDGQHDRHVVVDDVLSWATEALAWHIAEERASTDPELKTMLSLIDATSFAVRRLEPPARRGVTITVTRPAARVVALVGAEGERVMAIRDVAELVVQHDGFITPSLAAHVAEACARAFARTEGPR